MNIRFILGETVSVLAGGILYAAIMIYNGIWDKCLPQNTTVWSFLYTFYNVTTTLFAPA